jgi:hypothetical protein
MNKLKPWTITLLVMIIADSIFTSYLVNNGCAIEANALINWFMYKTGCNINTAMLVRVLFLLPLVLIVNQLTLYTKYTVIIYALVYCSITGFQVLHW